MTLAIIQNVLLQWQGEDEEYLSLKYLDGSFRTTFDADNAS